MKANAFREQVALLGRWFKEWNECEQTVAIYSLLKKSSPVQAKFLDQVLQQSLAECSDVKQLEAKANDEEFVRSLRSKEKERVIHQLLQLLPLLQVGQNSAKAAYLELIPELLSHTLHNGVNVEESRQLLSFSLIHPAISAEERRKLHSWMACLEERFTYNPAPGNISSSSSSNKSSSNNLSVCHSQSHSPSPASSSQHSIAHTSPDLSLSQEYNNLMIPSAAPSHGQSSPSPIIGSGSHLSWQQVQQPHSHNSSHPYSSSGGFDASAAINPPISNGETSAGCAQFVSPHANNGHTALRATNSHAGAFGASQGHVPLHATSSAPPNFTSLPPSVPLSQGSANSQKHHAPLRRTASVVPPGRYQNPEKTVSDWLNTNYDHQAVLAAGQQQLQQQQQPSQHSPHPILAASRHFPHAEHAPLSPQSSVTSSGSSDSHHEDGPQLRDIFLEEGSGMREVPVWLKTLRLHKYAYLFRQMEYEDMLNLTEDWLMQQNVTKGARHKFMININKLKERQEVLMKLEMSLMEERGSIKSALGEMKAMLNTPIKAYNLSHSQLVPNRTSNAAVSSVLSSVTSSKVDGPHTPTSSSSSTSTSTPQSPSSDEVADGDLPGQFCHLMGEVCKQLLVASRPDDECFQLYLQLIDKCLNHEAFSDCQKKRLQSRKQAAQKIWQPPPQKNGDRQRRGFWGNTFPFGNSVASRTIPRTGRGPVPISSQPQVHSGVQQWSFGSKRSILGSASNSSHLPLQRNSSLNTAYFNKPGLLEQQTKQSVSRTHSAPINQPLSLPLQCGDNPNDTEINARLDSLCISMTEHALGSSDAGDRGSAF